GATRDEIKDAIIALDAAGKDNTPELYVFFSGHGFFYTDTGGRVTANVLVAADFRNRAHSGDKCVNIDELRKELRLCMGKGDHFYFIAPCRNEIPSTDIEVVGLGLRLKRSVTGDPTVYTLYST